MNRVISALTALLFCLPIPADRATHAGAARAGVHWSFRRVARPVVPDRSEPNPIDRFIQDHLDQHGFELSPPAGKYQLIRRLSLDLTGLPPSVSEIAGFVNDDAPDACARLVDRLLASPHFGERWAMPWLDLTRYADSDGYEQDFPRPHVWRWRDWVIDSINRDVPFDQFTLQQLAGDLLPDATAEDRLATGFYRNALVNREDGVDPEESRVQTIVDRSNTTAAVWLGLTFSCAQCHTHKYDPITKREYFQLYAFFDDLQDDDRDTTPSLRRQTAYQRQRSQYEIILNVLMEGLESGEATQQQLAQHRETMPEPPSGTFNAIHTGPGRQSYVHQRGNFLLRGENVDRGTPAFLPPLQPRGAHPDRFDLARWIISPGNPLTARVAVNQIWSGLFGQGLVPTPEDFGTQGDPPTHPELLDWLASEFVHRRWSRKEMIRLIISSKTYRQSSAGRPELAERDPANRLLARQNRFRLDAELIRDQFLAASGLLCPGIGGESFRPPLPATITQVQFVSHWIASSRAELYRRGLYIHVQRNLLLPMLATFDRPDGLHSCPRRERSNSPLQALTTLNGSIFVESAHALAAALLRDDWVDDQQRIHQLFLRALARPPETIEQQRVEQLLAELKDYYQQDAAAAQRILAQHRTHRISDTVEHPSAAAWIAVCRTILNLDEAMTRE